MWRSVCDSRPDIWMSECVRWLFDKNVKMGGRAKTEGVSSQKFGKFPWRQNMKKNNLILSIEKQVVIVIVFLHITNQFNH